MNHASCISTLHLCRYLASSSMTMPAAGTSTARPEPRRSGSLDPVIPDDPPPAYEAATGSGEVTVASGPNRMDFSGPPPMPEGLQTTATGGQVLPGVGVGYGPTDHGPMNHGQWGAPPAPQQTGNGFAPPSGPPPSNPSTPQDHSPSEHPVPGRPLLHRGQLLVYPKGHYCHKCQNTGYKNADPSHPCSSDWRKYGKDFNGALASSYAIAPRPGANGTTNAATNFQRPLPYHHPAGPQHFAHPPPRPNYSTYPGMHAQHNYRPPIQQSYYGSPHPPNALVVQPGDPRIGGR